MIKKFISKLLGRSDGAAGAVPRGKRVEVPKSEHGIDPALVDQRRVDAVHFLGHLDALAGARRGLAGSGLAEQPVDEFLDHWSKSLKMRQPRSRATASSSGDGLAATGSVACSSRGRSLGESL